MKSYTYLLTVESLGNPEAGDVATDVASALESVTPPYQVAPLELFGLAGQDAYVANVSSPFGNGVWVCASEAGALHQVAEYARRNWAATAGTEEGCAVMPRTPAGLTDLETAQLFFTVASTEGYDIKPVKIRA